VHPFIDGDALPAPAAARLRESVDRDSPSDPESP
jgi:hypothetical protein